MNYGIVFGPQVPCMKLHITAEMARWKLLPWPIKITGNWKSPQTPESGKIQARVVIYKASCCSPTIIVYTQRKWLSPIKEMDQHIPSSPFVYGAAYCFSTPYKKEKRKWNSQGAHDFESNARVGTPCASRDAVLGFSVSMPFLLYHGLTGLLKSTWWISNNESSMLWATEYCKLFHLYSNIWA